MSSSRNQEHSHRLYFILICKQVRNYALSYEYTVLLHFLGTSQSQFTPRPTQEQEDRDFEVLNSNPKTEVLNLVSTMQTVSQTVTKLNLTGLGLDYLPSLTSFQQLETVDLSCNQIPEVRTSWVTPKSLASINLSHNNIEKFQIAPKPNLKNLNLSWNLMTNLSNLLEGIGLLYQVRVDGEIK